MSAQAALDPVRRLRRSVRRLLVKTRGATGLTRADLERRYNMNQMQRYEAVLNRHERSFRSFSSILEFGCGTGRLTQYLGTLAPQAAVSGCDVSSEAVAQCRRRCPRGQFLVNRWAPPLAFADAHFDLIYSYSVFTHLSEANHLAWLQELARLLRPGGMMLHTVHSPLYVSRTAYFSPWSLEKYEGLGSLEAFLASGEGYGYVIDHPDVPEYGHTLITRDYVMANWPRATGLDVLDYVEGAIEAYPEGCQDLVLLAKASS